MKEITLFYLERCPHCKLARQFQEELAAQYPGATIHMIEESRQPELAEQYDYYYVPCYYVDGEKIHEGHAEREDVERVFQTAAAQEAGVK